MYVKWQERSEVITTYAMCGFSAITSIGVCIGSMTAMVPDRKQDVVDIVMVAFVAGNLASFATGAVAGKPALALLFQQSIKFSYYIMKGRLYHIFWLTRQLSTLSHFLVII